MAADLAAQRRATAIGGLAILSWAALAWLGTATVGIPPFEVTGLSFAIGAAVAALGALLRGRDPRADLSRDPRAWALGVGGLFGYHACYFVAIKLAPPLPANLLNYTWPLLIVLLSSMLPGERLRPWHVAGAVLGFAGTALLLGGVSFEGGALLGYLAAAAAALWWSSYSVLSRRMTAVPTAAVGGFCAGTAVLALLAHAAVERWVSPTPGAWAALLALGIGPVGLAFFAWDHGCKRGNIKALGAASYAAPLLSTLLLATVGGQPISAAVVGAGALIVLGAALAGFELFRSARHLADAG